MGSKWFTSDTYHCTQCNMSKEVIKIVEEGVDAETDNPFGIIELKCGHTQKLYRVSKEFNIAPLFKKTQKVTVEPKIINGTPSLTVSGGGVSYVGVKMDFAGVQSSNFVMNISNVNVHVNNAVVNQNTSYTDIHANYNSIQQAIDRDISNENDKQEIKAVLQEIKNDLKSKQIPYSNLEKLRKYEKIYNMAQPWVMKAIDLLVKNGSINL